MCCIAYSGFVDEAVRLRAFESGFDMVLEAPLTQEKIKE